MSTDRSASFAGLDSLPGLAKTAQISGTALWDLFTAIRYRPAACDFGVLLFMTVMR
jgi:hypothetical protein